MGPVCGVAGRRGFRADPAGAAADYRQRNSTRGADGGRRVVPAATFAGAARRVARHDTPRPARSSGGDAGANGARRRNRRPRERFQPDDRKPARAHAKTGYREIAAGSDIQDGQRRHPCARQRRPSDRGQRCVSRHARLRQGCDRAPLRHRLGCQGRSRRDRAAQCGADGDAQNRRVRNRASPPGRRPD